MPDPDATLLSLPRWLRIATDNLSRDAEQRIRAEIHAHYSDALAAVRESGQSEEDAHRAAMVALGSPYEAARRFNKTYLTVQEQAKIDEWLESLKTPDARGKSNVFSVLSLILCLGSFLFRNSAWGLLLLLLSAFALNKAHRLYGNQLKARLLLKRDRTRGEWRLLLRSTLGNRWQTYALFGLMADIMAFARLHHGLPYFLILWVGLLANDITSFAALRRKFQGQYSDHESTGPDQYA